MSWLAFWQGVATFLYFMNIILVVFITINLVYRKLDPVKTLSWVLVVNLLPYIGVIIYLLLGQNYRKKKIFNRKGCDEDLLRKDLCENQLDFFENIDDLGIYTPYRRMLIQNLTSCHGMVGINSDIQLFFSGKEALDAMYKAISEAKHYIYLQSFIFLDDTIGTKFKELLMQKSKEGINVSVLYDSIGSWSNKKQFDIDLKESGVEVLEFSPVNIMMPTSKINYRNHRKVLVIDDEVAFIGGVNIADRYYDGGPYKEWRDTQMLVRGQTVLSLRSSYLMDRYFVLKENLANKGNPETKISLPQDILNSRYYYIQTLRSGPDSDWAGIMQCYFSAINLAQKSIKIITPYFTPCETLLTAIKVASLGGIEVSIMIPERADSKWIHYCTRSYIQELLDAGINVYLFKDGFNHSKVISIDKKICIVGSANMDNRSMLHDFEIINVIYDKPTAELVEKQFVIDEARCERVTSFKWKKDRNKWEKFKEGVARLVSPML